jgi:hypothetical protein
MATTPQKPIRKPGNPATKWPLIQAAADSLGIHRVTLYRVLERQFPDNGNYAAGYAAFVAKHKAAA